MLLKAPIQLADTAAAAAAAPAVVNETQFHHTFIINAHGRIPGKKIVSRLPLNVNMIKSYPGVGVPVEVSKGLFRHVISSPYGLSKASDALKFITKFYNDEKAEFYGNIYNSTTPYTDLKIEFKLLLNTEDDGDIVHVQPIGSYGKLIARLREIEELKINIFAQCNLKKDKYIVKLSDIITYIQSYVKNAPFLLIVTSCSYINMERENVLHELSAKRIDPSIIYKTLLDQGLYSKYLKYKKKYLNLKKLLN